MSMLKRWWEHSAVPVLASAAVFALSPTILADDCRTGCPTTSWVLDHWGPNRCQKKCPPYSSEFFGYYPTCWRLWPAGWTNCPGAAVPVPATGRATEPFTPIPKITNGDSPEQLPPPPPATPRMGPAVGSS
jgi:hypothetical protein